MLDPQYLTRAGDEDTPFFRSFRDVAFDSIEALHEYFRSGAFNENPIGTNIEVADLVARAHGTA